MSDRRTNINTELAKERNRAAAERTLMAWIRTCLALISFGFGVDRIVTALQQSSFSEYVDDPLHLTRIIGLAFIGIGTNAILLAAIEHRRELRHIQKDNYVYQPRSSLAFNVAISISITGLFAFIGILIKSYGN